MSDYFEQEESARYDALLASLKEAAAATEEKLAATVFHITLETRDGATLYVQMQGRPPRHITTPLRPRLSENPFVPPSPSEKFSPLQTREYELWSFSLAKGTALYKEA